MRRLKRRAAQWRNWEEHKGGPRKWEAQVVCHENEQRLWS